MNKRIKSCSKHKKHTCKCKLTTLTSVILVNNMLNFSHTRYNLHTHDEQNIVNYYYCCFF